MAVVVLVGSISSSSLVNPSGATATVQARRFAGADRYETAAVVAREFGTPAAGEALLASGRDFPDALAASYVAGARHVPILLTEPTTLPPSTLAALRDLGTTTVRVIGGPNSISWDVRLRLASEGFLVDNTSFAGVNRYSTAALLARSEGAEGVGSLQDKRTVFIASGAAFPDALSAGSASARHQLPILLTEPERVPAETEAALSELDPDVVAVLGGRFAVSDAVVERLVSLGYTVQRVAGTNRSATALAVADYINGRAGWRFDGAVLVNGMGFADALAGGPYAGALIGHPILLSEGAALGQANEDWLRVHNDEVGMITALGGTQAVPDGVVAQAVAAATITTAGIGCPTSTASGAIGRRFASTAVVDATDGIHIIRGDGTDLRQLRPRHSVAYNSLTWAPDDERLAYADGFSVTVIGLDGVTQWYLNEASTGLTGFGAAAWAPDGSAILFAAYSDPTAKLGDREAWLVNSDGSGLRRIDAIAVGATGWSWSPDSTRILYSAANRLRWTTLDGAAQGDLADISETAHSAWSPSGNEVAFRATDGLRVIRVDGTDSRALAAADGAPVEWSPTASCVLFSRLGLRVADTQAEGDRMIVPSDRPIQNARWVPDGQSLVFGCALNPDDPFDVDICGVNLDGSGQRKLVDVQNGDLDARLRGYSPGGDWLAFFVN